MTAPLDLDALERAALEATPGPWEVSGIGVGFEVASGGEMIAQAQQVSFDRKHELRKANAIYIAAANPSAILALISRLRAAEAGNIKEDE